MVEVENFGILTNSKSTIFYCYLPRLEGPTPKMHFVQKCRVLFFASIVQVANASSPSSFALIPVPRTWEASPGFEGDINRFLVASAQERCGGGVYDFFHGAWGKTPHLVALTSGTFESVRIEEGRLTDAVAMQLAKILETTPSRSSLGNSSVSPRIVTPTPSTSTEKSETFGELLATKAPEAADSIITDSDDVSNNHHFKILSLRRNALGPAGGAAILRAVLRRRDALGPRRLHLDLNRLGDCGLRGLPGHGAFARDTSCLEELSIRSSSIFFSFFFFFLFEKVCPIF